MSRDTSDLYPGSSSVSARKAAAKRDELENAAILEPSQQVIHEVITKEREKIKSVKTFDISVRTDIEDLKADLVARQKYDNYLVQFEKSLELALRKLNKERKANLKEGENE